MTNQRCIKRFRQSDVTRAVRAARAAGIDVQRIEVDPATGKITIDAKDGSGLPATELDRWVAKNARQTQGN